MALNLDPAAQADLAALFLELSHNPKTRKQMAKAIKDAKPESPHARAFSDVDMSEQMESFREEQAKKDLERQRDDMIARMNAKRAALLTGGPDGSGRRYGEDDIKKIEDLMQRKGISDYEDGATLYAATLPPIEQPSGAIPEHGATWEFPEWDKYATAPDKAARNTAHTMITDFMRKR